MRVVKDVFSVRVVKDVFSVCVVKDAFSVRVVKDVFSVCVVKDVFSVLRVVKRGRLCELHSSLAVLQHACVMCSSLCAT